MNLTVQQERLERRALLSHSNDLSGLSPRTRVKVAMKCFNFRPHEQDIDKFNKVSPTGMRRDPSSLTITTTDWSHVCVQMCGNEIKVWTNLDHRYILPVLGFARRDSMPALVSEWMEMGTIASYVLNNPHVDKWKLVS